MKEYSRHYEKSLVAKAVSETVFAYADDHRNFSSHMNRSSWMMGGGRMVTESDEGKGRKVGSHIRMSGNIFGVSLLLDEVVTKHEIPLHKEWETVGSLNLIVIDHYRLGFSIEPRGENSKMNIYIDYNLPKSLCTRILGYLFGGMYAKWCVNQMAAGVVNHFKNTS